MKIYLFATAALLAACGNDAGTAAQTDAPANTTAAAAGQPVALGLTARQLDDAELVDANGREIADVERVITGANGAVTGLLVEIEDSDPDRYVTIPLDGLAVVQRGDDRDLRGSYTREQLMAMPETPR